MKSPHFKYIVFHRREDYCINFTPQDCGFNSYLLMIYNYLSHRCMSNDACLNFDDPHTNVKQNKNK